MNTREAKEKLALYRGRVDDDDPDFREALAELKRDPELAKWLGEQCASYDAVQSKLGGIEPPADLADKIIRQRPISFPRRRLPTWQLAAAAAVFVAVGITALWLGFARNSFVQGQEITVRGEVLDMTCYISRNASGAEHASCARDCIKKGLPVGIKGENGKAYLLVGTTQPVNAELADYAAKTVTVKGKETMRNGFAQLQVVEIRKF